MASLAIAAQHMSELIPEMLKPVMAFVLTVAVRTYFFLVIHVFKLVNHFKQRTVVSAVNDPLLKMSATKARDLLKSRKVTSTELIAAFIKRIEDTNPITNAMIVDFFEEARELAKRADERISNTSDEGLAEIWDVQPLFGLPFTCKDSMQTAGKVTVCGHPSRRGVVSTVTATALQRMKDAGAIHLGLTNVPEMCMWVETANGVFGRTRNPYDSRRSVGGSSGGEGALLASCASLMSVGSDIAGSIRIPSAFNGLFGLLTSPGVIPLDGHIPESHDYQTMMARIGPIVRYAEDLPLLSQVMAGPEAERLNLNKPVDFGKDVHLFYLEGMTDCVAVEPVCKENLDSMFKVMNYFETNFDLASHKVSLPLTSIVDQLLFASIKQPGDPSFAELYKDGAGQDGPLNCYLEVAKWIIGTTEHSIAAILQGLTDSKVPFTADQRRELTNIREKLYRQVSELLGPNGIMFYPSYPSSAEFHNESVWKQTTMIHTGFVNILGLPAVTCPIGLSDQGTPLAVQVIACRGGDHLLMAAAREIEKAFGGFVPAGSS